MGEQVVNQLMESLFIPGGIESAEELVNGVVDELPKVETVKAVRLVNNSRGMSAELHALSRSCIAYVAIRRLSLVAELADRGDVSAAELATLARTGVRPESSTPAPPE